MTVVYLIDLTQFRPALTDPSRTPHKVVPGTIFVPHGGGTFPMGEYLFSSTTHSVRSRAVVMSPSSSCLLLLLQLDGQLSEELIGMLPGYLP